MPAAVPCSREGIGRNSSAIPGLAIAEDPKFSQVPGSPTIFALSRCGTWGPRGVRCTRWCFDTTRPASPRKAQEARARGARRLSAWCKSRSTTTSTSEASGAPTSRTCPRFHMFFAQSLQTPPTLPRRSASSPS
eukprot:scaffold3448_cov107-Isochrysis_galbana.AAC.4